MSCEACATARENPNSGRYYANCDGCAARALSRSPDFAEAARQSNMTPRYRMALAAFFAGREADGHRMVKDWATKHKEAQAT